MKKYIILVLSISIVFSCKHKEHNHHESQEDHQSEGHQHNHNHGDANEYMNHSDFMELVNRFESPERNEYQKPMEVIALMGDIKGKSIMEIGSGTGYFSFKLAEQEAKVIAADVDERFQKYIKDKRDSLGISEENLALRKVPYDSPDLSESEVDFVLIVNTYHHIENRKEYFNKVKAGLKENGKLMVVDFMKKETPVGPPLEMKMASSQVTQELKEAGFEAFTVNKELLPYQYVIIAEK